MANDDQNNFPKPPSFSNNSSTPPSDTPKVDNFEVTPDELPTNQSTPFADSHTEQNTPPLAPPPTVAPTEPLLRPATPPITHNSPTSSLLTLVLLILAGVGISGSIFLYSQSSVLKRQIADISQTLEQQKTTITPTPTPTIIEIPTPTPTASPSAMPSITAAITPTPTASISASKMAIPLTLSSQALQIGLNHEPNAQLLLVKVENANSEDNYLIKYFFRKDLTTKKYFYVTIDSKNESEIKTNAVYVNPDNNIPSLNDQVLGNKLGYDFEEVYNQVIKLCSDDNMSASCKDLPTTAQFIQSGSTNIWQLSLVDSNNKLIYQINAKTKEVLYRPSK